MKLFKIAFFLLISKFCTAQSVHTHLPKTIDKTVRYMFYLHGRIVEEQGKLATHPEFGSYEYSKIIDTLSKKGFQVISEARPKNTNEEIYAGKVAIQIDSLKHAGVLSKNIFVLGASKGAYIALWVSLKAKDNMLNYIVMGTCSEETTRDFKDHLDDLCGKFLSIYENSDTYSTSCKNLLFNQKCVNGFKEVELSMKNGHGYLYKPYEQWVNPVVKWCNGKL